MWQKAVAGICVMTGAFGFGYALCYEMNRLLFHYKEQKQMLLYMIHEISFMHMPMQEIFAAASVRLKEPYQSFTFGVSECMGERNGRTLYDIWSAKTEQMQKDGECPKAASAMLMRIGESFGCEGDKMQIDALRLIEEELSEEIAKMSRENEEKSRLIRTLSILAGLFCIVLFI